MAHRARINAALAERPLADGKVEKISLNDLLVRACALALIDVPEVNVSFRGRCDFAPSLLISVLP